MYTLLHGFYKYLTQKDEFCVLILGLDNAGKTVSNLKKFTIINLLKYSTNLFFSKQSLICTFSDVFGIIENKI